MNRKRAKELLPAFRHWAIGGEILKRHKGYERESPTGDPQFHDEGLDFLIDPRFDAVDWDRIEPEYMWVARDPDGRFAKYTEEPKIETIFDNEKWWCQEGIGMYITDPTICFTGTESWKYSKMKRRKE